MRRRIIRYNPALKAFARRLRNNSTLGEVLRWKQLRNKQLLGYNFHRHKPLDKYVVDFYCHELDPAIGVDGGLHESDEAQKKDAEGQERLESLGVRFLRFKDSEVRMAMRTVLATIGHWIRVNER